MNEKIDILLAMFNAEPYLKDQLDSLCAQTHKDWHLIIRDDSSSDKTANMVTDYCQSHTGNIEIIDDTMGNVGASQNFAQLLLHSTADYLMFCDQDDIWLPNKIEITRSKMKEMESKYGKDTPLLVHTDLKVVDENLNVLSDSLWHYQLSDPNRGHTLNRLLLQNVATGCSIMINRPLCDLALPIPHEAMMHDWWLVLVAAAFGHIECVSEPTALYRQHGTNDTGAKGWDLMHIFKSMCNFEEMKNRTVMHKIQRQTEAFLQTYGQRLTGRQKEVLNAYVRLPELNFFMKRYYTIKYGFYYTGLIRNIGRLLIM